MKQLVLERFESEAATALHRPEPEPEEDEALRAEAEARAAEEAAAAEARAQREEALCGAVRTLADAIEQSRNGAIQAVCSDLASAVAGALPGLLAEGFAKEAALACAELTETAGIGNAALRASPSDTETIIAVLEKLAPAQAIQVTADNSLPDGQVRLDWGTGGAVFDADAWATEIRTRAAAQIDGRMNEGMEK